VQRKSLLRKQKLRKKLRNRFDGFWIRQPAFKI
jgi:hypothetical protein